MANFPFPNKISSASVNQRDQKVIIANYGNGYEQRAAMGLNSIWRVWDIAMNGLTETQRDTLISFYNSHGKVLSFDWTPPGESVSQKWVFESPISETNNGCLYSFAFTLRQVFEA